MVITMAIHLSLKENVNVSDTGYTLGLFQFYRYMIFAYGPYWGF